MRQSIVTSSIYTHSLQITHNLESIHTTGARGKMCRYVRLLTILLKLFDVAWKVRLGMAIKQATLDRVRTLSVNALACSPLPNVAGWMEGKRATGFGSQSCFVRVEMRGAGFGFHEPRYVGVGRNNYSLFHSSFCNVAVLVDITSS